MCMIISHRHRLSTGTAYGLGNLILSPHRLAGSSSRWGSRLPAQLMGPREPASAAGRLAQVRRLGTLRMDSYTDTASMESIMMKPSVKTAAGDPRPAETGAARARDSTPLAPG